MELTKALLAGLFALVLAGCGAAATPTTSSHAASVPSYVTEPFTHQQQLVEQGARLVIVDGCSACHLALSKPGVGPSFASFAGHRVTLANGHTVVVDEHFLRTGLTHPRGALLKGYDPAPMLAALARLHLDSEPQQVAALAAFIEQIGPEPE
jgi:hypothetical protein